MNFPLSPDILWSTPNALYFTTDRQLKTIQKLEGNLKEEAELNQTLKANLAECEKQIEKLGLQLAVHQEEKEHLVQHLTTQILVRVSTSPSGLNSVTQT